jgi:SAM-dependent methyltransferase
MKHEALAFLACPGCKADLSLSVDREDGAEIMAGLLTCRGCDTTYPIVRGIPRFVGEGSYASSFGFQWNTFRTTQLDSQNGTTISADTLNAATGWTATDYHGQLVLDVGVGSGRFAEIVAGAGGRVVGVDLTTAVDAAFATIGRRPNVHLIQADVFHMPFRDATFDKAYAVGVLHHTPDPEAAFGRMVATLKDGGAVALYLYARYGPQHRFADAIRTVTTRMPLRLMLWASSAAVPLYYVYRLPVVGSVLRTVAPISMHEHWRWRWLDTFDWYTPRYQFKYLYPEVFRWFTRRGMKDIEIFDDPIRIRGTRHRAAEGRLSAAHSDASRHASRRADVHVAPARPAV